MTPKPRTFVVVDVAPSKPTDRFRLWAKAYGVSRLARSMNVSYRYVQLWLGGTHPPRPDAVRTLIGISKEEPCGIGPLKYDDIFGKVEVLGKAYRNYSDGHIHAPRFVPIRRRA